MKLFGGHKHKWVPIGDDAEHCRGCGAMRQPRGDGGGK